MVILLLFVLIGDETWNKNIEKNTDLETAVRQPLTLALSMDES